MTAPSSFPVGEKGARDPIKGVLNIALLMSLTYIAFFVMAGVLRAVHGNIAAIELLVRTMPDSISYTADILGDAWIPAAIIWLIGVTWRHAVTDSERNQRRYRNFQVVILAMLVLPYGICAVEVALQSGAMLRLLMCLPTTAFALWSTYRMQRYRRMSPRLPLMAFAWGALIAPGYSVTTEFFSIMMSYRLMPPVETGRQLIKEGHAATAMTFFSAGLFEELAKGAGIAIVFILFRRQVDGVVSGIVIGASAGIGFNLFESFGAMHNGAATQFWLRQSVGIMAAHTAFSAVVGAGFGVAQGQRDDRLRSGAITSGFVAAIGGHFASDAILAAVQEHHWLAPNPTIEVLIVLPAVMAVMQGPFVVMYLWLLRRGLREQANALSVELQAEARTGLGAVTAEEATVLLNPALRFWLKITALREHGITAYRRLGRLHAAQFELARQRRRDARWQADPRDVDVQTLRDRVLRLRSCQVVTVQPVPQLETP